jgi:hypothetical protein
MREGLLVGQQESVVQRQADEVEAVIRKKTKIVLYKGVWSLSIGPC